MAIKYVDSNASGANDGTSWTDAWTSLSSSTSVAAGDEVRVAHNHNQNYGSDTTLNWSNGTINNPVKILSVNSGTDALQAGATISTTVSSNTGIQLHGGIYMYGLTVTSDDDWDTYADQVNQTFDTCTFSNGATAESPALDTSADDILVTFIDCTFNHISGGDETYNIKGRGNYRFINCTWNTPLNATLFKDGVGNSTSRDVIFECCDLSNATGLWDAAHGSGAGRNVIFRRCKFGASTTLTTGTWANAYDSFVRAENCDDGTISVPPLGIWEEQQYWGTIKATTARYRTGGADDGEQANAYSWELASNANTLEQFRALRTAPFVRWVDAGSSQTVTIYVVSGATLNDDDFWIEVQSPNETASPNTTAQGNYQSTRMALRGSPAALTTDSGSTWNGSGVGTKQKIDVTINPAEAGPVSVKCFLAKPSTTVYVDPLIDIS